jgi:hypothetical protein
MASANSLGSIPHQFLLACIVGSILTRLLRICVWCSTGAQRKKARAEASHAKGTSSENSKASRTTQQNMELEGGGKPPDSGFACQRGESANSEQQSKGDACDQHNDDNSKHSTVSGAWYPLLVCA